MSESAPPNSSEKSFALSSPPHEPVFNIPGVLVLVIAFMGAVFVAQAYLLDASTAQWIDVHFGFVPLRYLYPFFDQDYAWIWTPLTYSFLHGSVEHLLFNGLWLAAFGTPVVRRIGNGASIAFWIAASAASAFFYAALHWGAVEIVIGASGVISAFMGAACRFAFPPRGPGFSRRPVHTYPRLSIRQVFASRTASSFLILWLIGNLLVAFGLPLAGTSAGQIAWEAHIGGLVFGFIAFPLFDRRQGANSGGNLL